MFADDPQVTVSPGTSSPEVPERTYHIVLVADFGSDRMDALAPIDKERLPEALAAAKPSLALAVPNPGGDGDEWEFRLTFDSLRSFEPAGVLKQIPQAGWRLGVREKLLARRAGEITPEELDRIAEEAAQADASLAWLPAALRASPAPASDPATSGGSILDQIDEPGAADSVSSEVQRLAADAGDASKRISAGEADRLKAALARIDRELGGVCEAVLKNDEFRGLERAWRGLRFLVDRIDFREGVRLWALHATREEALERLIERVINPAFDGDIPTPGMILIDYPFANTPADIQLLDQIAQQAASLPVPAVAPIDAAFFDVKNLRLIKNLPNLPGLIDSWQFAKWRALRDQPYAKSLAPVVGRFILRPPHQARSDAREYTHAEQVGKVSDLLWAYGHLAMGVCAARAFVQHGWPTRMYGAEAGKIEDLPVVDNPNDPQSPWGPGDLYLPDRRLDELPQIGMNQLLAVKNHDYCLLLGGVTAARPIKTADTSSQQAALEISLPYQQFANIAGAYVCEQMSSLHGLSESQIQQRLITGLADLMGVTADDDPDAVQVGVGKHPDNPQQTVVQIRLQPPGRIVPGGLHIEFGFAV